MQERLRDVVADERRMDVVVRKHDRQRQHAAGDAFGQAHEVGRDRRLLAGEHRTRASEPMRIPAAPCTSGSTISAATDA